MGIGREETTTMIAIPDLPRSRYRFGKKNMRNFEVTVGTINK